MELIKQLEELNNKNNFTREEVVKICTPEDIFFLLQEKTQGEPNYLALYDIFEDIRLHVLETETSLNIFEEHLILKIYFLNQAYDISTLVLNALTLLIGPVLADYQLENRFFKDNEFAKYYFGRYQEYKQNNELNIFRLIKDMDVSTMTKQGEQLDSLFSEMKEKLEI